MTLPQQKTHRASSLKQKNKKHHTLGPKSKRALGAIQKGRVNDVIVIRKAKLKMTKTQKKNQHDQIKRYKTEETIKTKRSLGTNDTAPFLVLIVPMTEKVRPYYILESLCTADSDAIIDMNVEGVTHIGCNRFKKRLSFISPSTSDWTSILDAAKVSDSVLFVWDANEEDMREEAKMLLTVMKSQGLPTVIHAVSGLDGLSQKKKMRYHKEMKKEIGIIFTELSKLFSLDNKQEALLLLRQLAEQKKHELYFRDKRSHMLAEELEFAEEINSRGTLKISGYVRGECLNINSVIHIPGWENYQMECIESLEDPHLMGKSAFCGNRFVAVKKIFPSNQLQRSLESIKEVSLMDQYKKTATDVIGTDERVSEEESDESADEFESANVSDFETEDSLSEISSNMDYESALESFSEGEADDEEDDEANYDDQIDYDSEMISLKQSRDQEVEDNKKFPDEIDTPFDQLALVRFNKYRGLQSFRTSPWDHYDDLPIDYKRIFNCRNYHYLRKSILKREEEGVKTGSYVCIHLRNVSKRLYEEHVDNNLPLILFSILEHEQEMSILNLVLKSHSSGHVDAIKSKERLIFHVGFRRFANCPIFSEHTYNKKFLFLRYFHPTTTVMASMFAPVTFSPCPVAVFKERYDGRQELVATGSVYSVDEKRIICKRICLSGHPLKIKPNVTVVRYMFFSREDIEFFKKIELRTKLGSRGKIVGPIGTHGHMKCSFKDKLSSQDVIFLNLYKRAFPKLKYEPLVHRLRNTFDVYSYREEEESLSEEPKMKKQKKVQFVNK